jgi:hypothetical protein
MLGGEEEQLNMIVSILKRVFKWITITYLLLFALGVVLAVIEDLSSPVNNNTIIRGEYKEWKPKKWVTPKFPKEQK